MIACEELSEAEIVAARQKLIEDHLWIVRTIALASKDKPRPGEPIEDTDEYAEGCLALCLAAKEFDPASDKFSPFAFSFVKEAIQRLSA